MVLLEVLVRRFLQVPVQPEMLVLRHLLVVVDRPAGDFARHHPLDPDVARLRLEGLDQLPAQPFLVVPPLERVHAAVVLDQILPFQHAAQHRPVLGIEHADREPLPVGALVPRERGAERLARLQDRLRLRVQVGLERQRLQRQHRAQLRDVDLLADAEAFPRQQRRHDPVGEHDAAGLIGQTPRRRDRPLARPAAQRHHRPAHPLRDHVERSPRRPLALRPEAAVGRVDQLRIHLLQRLVSQPDAVEVARPEILRQHVRLGDQLVDDLDRPLRPQVQRHRALAPVQRLEVRAEPVRAHAQLPPRIPVARHLDLEHVRAHVRQHRRRVRPVLVAREIHHLDSVQRCSHPDPPSTPRAGAQLGATLG